VFLLWARVCLTVLRLSLEASSRMVLWLAYGRETVARAHLSIVSTKPHLVVSNGDVLRDLGPLHFAMGVLLWIPSSVILLIVLGRCFARPWWDAAMKDARPPRPGVLGIVAAIVMFFTIPSVSLLPAIGIGAAGATVGLIWLRSSVSRSEQNVY
jgi:hypothetical protein